MIILKNCSQKSIIFLFSFCIVFIGIVFASLFLNIKKDLIFIAQAATIVDGDIIQNPSAIGDAKFDIFIVKIKNGKKFKRLILNPAVFTSYGHLKWENLKKVSNEEFNSFSTSALVRVEGDQKIMALAPNGDKGSKSWLNVDRSIFISAGGDEDSVYQINAVDNANYVSKNEIKTKNQVIAFLTNTKVIIEDTTMPEPISIISPTPAPIITIAPTPIAYPTIIPSPALSPTPTPIVAIPSISPTPAPTEAKKSPCGFYGDVNNDGFVTKEDTTLISNYMVGNIDLTENQKIRGDVNGVDGLKLSDAMLIAKYIAGSLNSFMVCPTNPDSVQVARKIVSQNILAGNSTKVNLTITNNGKNQIVGITEKIPLGWKATQVSDDAFMFFCNESNGQCTWTWKNIDAGTTKIVVYDLKVASSSRPEQYIISGTQENEAGFIAQITGQNTINVISSYVVRPIVFLAADTNINTVSYQTQINKSFEIVRNWYSKQLNGKTFNFEPAVVYQSPKTSAELHNQYGNGTGIWYEGLKAATTANKLNLCDDHSFNYFITPLDNIIGGMVGAENLGCSHVLPGTAAMPSQMGRLLGGIGDANWPEWWADETREAQGGAAHELAHGFGGTCDGPNKPENKCAGLPHNDWGKQSIMMEWWQFEIDAKLTDDEKIKILKSPFIF